MRVPNHLVFLLGHYYRISTKSPTKSASLDAVAMRSKGKQSKKEKLLQDSESFKNAGHKHSAVESCINALEVHGLDKCYDHGIEGFKCYTSLAIVSRNIHIIGDMLHKKSKANLARKKNATARLLLAA